MGPGRTARARSARRRRCSASSRPGRSAARAGWIGPAARRAHGGAICPRGAAGRSRGSGFAEQRHYLERRYENLSPQLGIADAVRWARDLRDATYRGLGRARGLQPVRLLRHRPLQPRAVAGREGPDGAYVRIPDCATWRAAVNEGDYDYVVTMYDPYAAGRGSPTPRRPCGRAATRSASQGDARRPGRASSRSTASSTRSACGDLPGLDPTELDGDSVNLDPTANQPYAEDLLPDAVGPEAAARRRGANSR